MENIQRLTEMGFSVEQSQEALRITNNDVSKAIDYLFDEPIEIDAPQNENTYQDHQVPNQDPGLIEQREVISTGESTPFDTVSLSNPQDVPDFSNYVEEPRSGVEKDELLDIEMEPRTKECPPVVISERTKFLENYIVPLVLILAHNYKFQSMIFREIPDNDTESAKFLREIQHMVYYYLRNDTVRNFISASGVLSALPSDFKTDLTRIDNVEDAILKIYETIEHHFTELFPKEGEVSEMANLVSSCVESIEDGVKSGVSVLEIEIDNRSSNLYNTLNSLFWQRNLEKLGLIKYNTVSPIMTFHLNAEDDDDNVNYHIEPFKIDEVFYPELYTEKYLSSIASMRAQEVKYEEERSAVTNNLLNLNFFEGKKVSGFFTQLQKYLEKKGNLEVLSDLTNLAGAMDKERAVNLEKQESLRLLMASSNIRHYENVLKYIKEKEPDRELVPYNLIGIILRDWAYFYKYGEDWYYYEGSSSDSSNKLLSYSVEKFEDFQEIQEMIFDYSRHPKNGITLIYEHNNDAKVDVDIAYLEQKFTEDEESMKKRRETRQDLSGPDLIPDQSSAESSNASLGNSKNPFKSPDALVDL